MTMKKSMVAPVLTTEATEAALAAIHAAKNAAQAVENARALQIAALNENTTNSLIDALRQVFGENSDKQRFIDVKKIPLICAQIDDIQDNIKEIKEMFRIADLRYVNQDQFFTVKALSFGFAGAVLSAFVAALIVMVFKVW